MVDGSGTAEVALEFLIEAEDGALAAAVNVAGTTAAGSESHLSARVEASQRGWAGGRSRIGGLGVLEADDIATASTASVHGRASGVRHRGVRLDDAVT